MSRYSFSHLPDPTLLHNYGTHRARACMDMAVELAYLAEIDARRLFIPAGYDSMHAWCVDHCHMAEDAAFKRIKAARAARRVPALFEAVAEGRLHLSAIVLLSPHLTAENAGELIAAATHKTKAQIEELVAERFPKPDMLAWVEPTPAAPSPQPCDQRAPGPVRELQSAPARAAEPARVTPLSSQSFAVQFTMSQAAHEKLRYAQELLSHQVGDGDIAAVLERALDALIPQLEKRKFAATKRPRRGHRVRSRNPRHIPAGVMRAIWERDGGQCTFVSVSGHRCAARKRLEFDHVLEVARGGEATLDGIRLRCRAHNQYGAECTFGAEFMRHKRIAAIEARAAARTQKVVNAREHVEEVVPWLRSLGFNATEARRAAEGCEDMPDAPLEERVRLALTCFRARGARTVPAPPRDAA